MKDIYINISENNFDETPLVLATVTQTTGSAPQKPGCSALIGRQGLVAGTVGGGVVEGKILKIASEALESKKSGLYRFNLSNDISSVEEAICGGEITILVDADPSRYISVFRSLSDSLKLRKPGILLTMLTSFAADNVMINRYWVDSHSSPELPSSFTEDLKPLYNDIFSLKDSSDFRRIELSIKDEEPSSVFYLEAVFPPWQLIIAGAGHIGRALVPLAKMVGFSVLVIDNRVEFANPSNIPDADEVIVGEIGNTIKNIKFDKDTFIVIVTRGHNDDAEALRSCFGRESAYVGMIGSKKKTAIMKKNFIQNNWATESQWNSIYAPVGLDINSRSVEEIAISIVAQLIMVRNSAKH